MNILILGANTAIARRAEQQILHDEAFNDIKLTMFTSNKHQVDDLLSPQSITLEGEINDYKALNDAVEDQDIVFDLDDKTDAHDLLEIMLINGVNRLVTIAHATTELFVTSELDYTVLQTGKMTRNDEIDFAFDQAGTAVSEKSVAHILAKILDDPDYLAYKDVKVVKPK